MKSLKIKDLNKIIVALLMVFFFYSCGSSNSPAEAGWNTSYEEEGGESSGGGNNADDYLAADSDISEDGGGDDYGDDDYGDDDYGNESLPETVVEDEDDDYGTESSSKTVDEDESDDYAVNTRKGVGNGKCSVSVTQLQDSITSINTMLTKAKSENEQLNKRILALLNNKSSNNKGGGSMPSIGGTPKAGTYYRIQVASLMASRNKIIYPGMENFIERTPDSFKYMYGYFSNFKDANEARNLIQRVGIKDAWIVKYIDGVRRTR